MRIAIVVFAAALALAACGDDRATTLTCADVWQVGKTLPSDYDGYCAEPGGVAISDLATCTDGAAYSTHRQQLFAKLGGEVFAGPKAADGQLDAALTAAYDKFVDACLG